MKLRNTDAIRQVLGDVEGDITLSNDVRNQASMIKNDEAVEWDVLKHIARLANEQKAGASPPLSLRQMCRGSELVLEPPPSRSRGKSPELAAHLENLKRKLEQSQYDQMVADVIQAEVRAVNASEGGLVTYRKQLSFGVHVLVMMGTFFAFGHIVGTAITPNKALHPVFGLVFMIFAMLLETVLYVVRSTTPPTLQSTARRQKRARSPQAVGIPSAGSKKTQ